MRHAAQALVGAAQALARSQQASAAVLLPSSGVQQARMALAARAAAAGAPRRGGGQGVVGGSGVARWQPLKPAPLAPRRRLAAGGAALEPLQLLRRPEPAAAAEGAGARLPMVAAAALPFTCVVAACSSLCAPLQSCQVVVEYSPAAVDAFIELADAVEAEFEGIHVDGVEVRGSRVAATSLLLIASPKVAGPFARAPHARRHAGG